MIIQTGNRLRKVGLEYLSVFGMPVLDYADLAARLECDFISLNLRGAPNRMTRFASEDLRMDAGLRSRLRKSVAALGLRVCLAEGFAITPTSELSEHERDLDAAAELGASAICAVTLDEDMCRTHAQFAALAEAASSRGLVMTTEATTGALRTFEASCNALAAVGHPNFKLLIDTMHFFRRGAAMEDLNTLPSEAIGHVQLCDVPMPAQMASYMDEALHERRSLGKGDLPLKQFLDSIDPSVPLGLEIPIRSLAESGVEAYERLLPSVVKAREYAEDR